MKLEAIRALATKISEDDTTRYTIDEHDLAEAVLKLLDVAEAAKKYRDKVDYTGGDGIEYFIAEQDRLDTALIPLNNHTGGSDV